MFRLALLFTCALSGAAAAFAQDPPKPAAAPAPAKIEYLTAWPKPADKDALMTDIERLCKARTEDMGKLAHDAIQARLDRAQLVYLDESWRALVPLSLQHRLRGGNP